jgi:hypothetical protein
MKRLTVLEILVGLLALLITVINLYPFKFFGRLAGTVILPFGIMISALILLVVGVLRLVNVYSNETLNLPNKTNVATSVLLLATSVTILYFQIIGIESSWLHFLFGIGLLSCAVGLFTIGVFTKEHNLGLRAFNVIIGLAVCFLSTIVILFPGGLLSSLPLILYANYGYFTNVALVFIWVNYVISGILGVFLSKQKTEALEAKCSELA